jgi:hypothetical protein
MSWSAGSYSRLYGAAGWVDDRDAGTKILATRHDAHDQDLAAGINACLTKDGSNAATGDLNLGANKITAMADPTSAQDAATKAYVDASNTSGVILAAGDQILWRGGTLPTGWTVASVNNRALRIVSGTPGNGGATGFTSVFGSSKTTGSGGSHNHTAGTLTTSTQSNAGSISGPAGIGFTGSHNHAVSGSTSTASTHTHTLSLDLLYYDMQLIEKS